MNINRLLRLARRLSVLDYLTVVVLTFAVFVLIRPGSAVHGSVSRWLTIKDTERAANRNWNTLAAVATPLYEGSAEPEVIEFSDYECPFCVAAAASVDSAVRTGIRLAIIHFPLPIHPQARPAALAAICAGDIGRFKEAHRFLMTTDQWKADTTSPLLSGILNTANSSMLAECVVGGKAEARLADHVALADSLHIMGTPTFVSRRGVLREAPTAKNLAILARGDGSIEW